MAPSVAKSQGAGCDGREGMTNKVRSPGRPPSPLVSDPAFIVASNPISDLASLACKNEKTLPNVMTSFNRKTRAGKGKRAPPLLETPRRSKEAEAPVIASVNLVAGPEVEQSETVETREASFQPVSLTGVRGGVGESLLFVSVLQGAWLN